jgi:hypothetical protein
MTLSGETMKTGASHLFRRSFLLAVLGILAVVLTACTGVGGGYLPPGQNVLDPKVLYPYVIDPIVSEKFSDTMFNGQAPFGFTFSCEDKGGLNPPTGKLAIELAYSDQGTSALNAPFGIHGIVDKIDPVLESMICIGSNPPSPPNELIFLGRYRPTSSSKPGALKNCPSRETTTSPMCRFEVFVRDNDKNLRPSKGDFFSIQLSSATAVTSELDPLKVFYARAGYLAGGNITVK